MLTYKRPNELVMLPSYLHQEQLRQRIRVIRTEHNGRKVLIEEVARELGIKHNSLGWKNIQSILEEQEFQN